MLFNYQYRQYFGCPWMHTQTYIYMFLITFIDKTDPSDPVQREDYWRQTLKTMVPYGLKIEERLCLLFLHVNISFFTR